MKILPIIISAGALLCGSSLYAANVPVCASDISIFYYLFSTAVGIVQ